MSDLLRPHDAALERLRGLHPKLIDLSLGRMSRLCTALGDPQDRLPRVVHVAGTNGKGSTIAFLRAIGETAGLRVHAFTSPHLVRFAERIRLAGRLIDEAHLADVLARVEAVNAGQPITFFEVTAAAAFVAMAETPADLCLVEVGLGGRYDATNVIARPALTVVAPVAIDHREFLGDTIAQIAGEKAGIAKPGVPLVVAHQTAEAAEVIEAEAERVGAPTTLAGRDFDAWSERGGLVFQDGEGLIELPRPALAGPHQIGNAGLAVAAARRLGLPDKALGPGLSSARWPARMQRLTAGPLGEMAAAHGADLWLDGAHNPHGAAAAARAMADLRARDGRPVAIVLGLLANKDADGVFEAMRPLAPFTLVCTAIQADAAADPWALVEAARLCGLPAQAAPHVTMALRMVLAECPSPHALICGSLYLAGEVLAMDPPTWPS